MLMNKTEMRMLRWIQGVSLREHKRNEEIRAAATVQPIATHLMQKRLRWRRDNSHRPTTRTVLDMVIEDSPDRRCETERKTEIKIHGYHQKRHQEEWDD